MKVLFRQAYPNQSPHSEKYRADYSLLNAISRRAVQSKSELPLVGLLHRGQVTPPERHTQPPFLLTSFLASVSCHKRC